MMESGADLKKPSLPISNPVVSASGEITLKASLTGPLHNRIPDCVVLISIGESLHLMRGLGKWASAVQRARSARLKARRKKSSSERMSSLPTRDQTSGPGESAAVHFVQSDLSNLGDEVGVSDNDPAVVNAVEILSVARSDVSARRQEKESRTVGGIPSR